MKYCLICGGFLSDDINWAAVFGVSAHNGLCRVCLSAFERIEGQRCQKCSRPTRQKICSDCLYWQTFYHQQDVLKFNQSIYTYNQFMQDFMTQWKYRGDYCLGHVFDKEIKHFYQNEMLKVLPEKLVVVPIPLSDSRIKVRAFNQAAQLASFFPLPQKNILIRTSSEKQSKKRRYDRLRTQNPFKAHKKITDHILLVDDIYTTGRTLRHAADALLEVGCPSVSAFTLIRS